MRVKRGFVRRRKHKKLFKFTKGFYGENRNIFRRAKETLLKAGNQAFRDRRVKKRIYRRGWITVINNACRENGLRYSEFINRINESEITLNRKMLAQIAQKDSKAFAEIVSKLNVKS